MPSSAAAGLVLLLLTVSTASPSWAVEPSIAPGPSSMPTPSDVPVTETSPSSMVEPGWSRLRTGRAPAAREDHTWTVDAEARHAYLFGGRDAGRVFGDLWRFDLSTDTWRRLTPRGASPPARFGHNAVWLPGEGLIVFAGQRGADFFGDLWAFDPQAGRWTELPARGAAPRARYGSCMVVGPDARLRISHGFTFAGRFDDTRAYDPATRRWTSVAPGGRRPGERCLHDCFTSARGELVLFGGQDDGHVALGDLWVARAGGSWRKLRDPSLGARRLYALAEAGEDAWVFGGAGADGAPLDDLWRVDRESLRFERVRVAGAAPSARYAATLIHDPPRGRLLLFGGRAREARSDLWQLVDVAATPESEPITSPSPSPLTTAAPPA